MFRITQQKRMYTFKSKKSVTLIQKFVIFIRFRLISLCYFGVRAFACVISGFLSKAISFSTQAQLKYEVSIF